jgi:Xaa-Pro aminopeptidase
MPGRERFTARIERLQALLAQERLDAILLTGRSNLHYVTGIDFYWQPLNLLLGSWNAVIVTEDGATLVVFASEATHTEGCDWLERRVYGTIDGGFGELRSLLGGRRAVGIEGDAASADFADALADGGALELRHVHHRISRLRMVKDADELDLMRRASAIADSGLQAAIDATAEGVRELEIAAAVEAAMHAAGATDLAFKTTVACGRRAEYAANWLATEAVVPADSTVWFDIGPSYLGYAADATRTVLVGDPPAGVAKLAETVMAARAAAEACVRPGEPAHRLDEVVKEVVGDAGCSEWLFHPSHGVGIDVIEPPHMWRADAPEFEIGMTFAIEIGLHVPGTGCFRIEDVYALLDTGVERLNRHPLGE